VGNNSLKILLNGITVKKNVLCVPWGIDPFCCFAVEMLHRRVEIEKQEFRKGEMEMELFSPPTTNKFRQHLVEEDYS